MPEPYEPHMPPYPFVRPFDPPGVDPPYEPEEPDGPVILTPPPEPPPPPVWPDDYPPGTPDSVPHAPWWPEDYDWPPRPETRTVIECYPPIHTWPRLPPDYPVVHPGDWGDDWPSYPGIFDNWPSTYEDDE